MRALLVLSLLIVVAVGCGSEPEPPDTRQPGTDAPSAGAEPSEPPPKLDIEGPPPAWIETESGAHWLGYWTYCWESACADYVPPTCGESWVPDVAVHPGERVRFHLGFYAEKARIMSFGRNPKTTLERPYLASGRSPTWVVNRPGPIVLSTRSRDGRDAGYVACLRFAGDAGSSSSSAIGEGISVEQALAANTDEPLLVRGGLLVEGDEMRLCSGFAESSPPQCAGAHLVVKGLDPATVDGFTRVGGVGFAEVKLLGTVDEGVLTVLTTASG